MFKNVHYLYSEYYSAEMYKGQKHWKEYAKNLPGSWKLLFEFPNDVLLENLDFKNEG